jgi:hypothetical protein
MILRVVVKLYHLYFINDDSCRSPSRNSIKKSERICWRGLWSVIQKYVSIVLLLHAYLCCRVFSANYDEIAPGKD